MAAGACSSIDRTMTVCSVERPCAARDVAASQRTKRMRNRTNCLAGVCTGAPLRFWSRYDPKRKYDRQMARLSLAALVFVGYCPLSALAQVSSSARDLSYLDPLRDADRLSLSKAARLENQLLQRPEDLSVRASLISHYFQHATAQPRISHILWVIQHHPGSKLAGSPVTRVTSSHDVLSTRSDYESVRIAWIRQIDANPAQPDILANAAAFFEMEEPSRSEVLLKRALRLQPENKFRLAALAKLLHSSDHRLRHQRRSMLRSRVDHASEIRTRVIRQPGTRRGDWGPTPFPNRGGECATHQDRRLISLAVIEPGGGTALNQGSGVVRGANTFNVK